MPNVVKKLIISSELAQKMVNAAVAKAKELGVAENVAILDDGDKPQGFYSDGRGPNPNDRNGAEQSVHSSVRRPYTGCFQPNQGRSVAFGRHSRALAHCGLGWRVSDQGEWRTCRGDRGEGPPTVQNDIDCASAALALVCAAVGGGTTLNLQGNPTEKPMC